MSGVVSGPDIDPQLAEVIEMAQRGRPGRLIYAAMAAVLLTAVAPLSWLVWWYVAVLMWELVLEPRLNRVVSCTRKTLTPTQRMHRYAVVSSAGGVIYCVLGLMGWHSDTMFGAVLGTAWIGGSALHIFVYLSRVPVLLVYNMMPSVLIAIIGPIVGAGAVTLETTASSFIVMTLFAAARSFSVDRNALLAQLDSQAKARVEAEVANTQKTQFLATMSHELRTPLNAVIGYAEILDEDITTGEADPADARRIRQSGLHLLNLINEVLDLAKLEANKLDLEPEPTDVTALLHQVKDTLQPLAERNGNTLNVVVQQNLPVLKLDPKRLTQCLLNLGANACKFTKNGQVEINVSAVRTDEGMVLWARVKDTGCGIAEDQLARLFQPFVQVEGGLNRSQGGTGLGLAITRKLARLMGGDVTAKSVFGTGSTFTLRLMASVVQPRATSHPDQPRAVA